MSILIGAGIGFGISSLVALSSIGNPVTNWGERIGIVLKSTFGGAILGVAALLITGV
jgi:hypothetical protein